MFYSLCWFATIDLRASTLTNLLPTSVTVSLKNWFMWHFMNLWDFSRKTMNMHLCNLNISRPISHCWKCNALYINVICNRYCWKCWKSGCMISEILWFTCSKKSGKHRTYGAVCPSGWSFSSASWICASEKVIDSKLPGCVLQSFWLWLSYYVVFPKLNL